MTTAVAAMPATAALAPPSMPTSLPSIAPSSATPQRNAAGAVSRNPNSHSPPTQHESTLRRTGSDGKRSPQSGSRAAHIPKVIVKKEPTSPDLPTGRHRPSRLNLASSNMSTANGQPSAARPSAGPLTSRDQMQSAGLVIHDIGVACLSPGFNTQDPTMREQMERAMNIREQQRRLIEDRQKGKTSSRGAGDGGPPTTEAIPPSQDNIFNRPTKTPMTSRRKGPPAGLSIAAPAPEQFANERVIQSAPLHASFPRHHVNPLSRQVMNGAPSNLSSIHHVHATQTQNRLPPIADVFPEVSASGQPSASLRGPHGRSSPQNQPPMPSPSYPPHTSVFPPSGHGHHALASRPREHKSAEEALKELTGGREDLLPRLVHYGGHQPPTPPSPKPSGLGLSAHHPAGIDLHRSGSSRRRDRDEYERDNGSPPLGRQPLPRTRSDGMRGERLGAFGEVRDSPATEARKKEEFLQLVSRAWDLWHS